MSDEDWEESDDPGLDADEDEFYEEEEEEEEAEELPAHDPEVVAAIQERLRLEHRFRTGVGWLFWIAGLSIINSVLFHTGSGFGFVFGLGIAQIIDGVVMEINPQAHMVALALAVVVAGVFVGLGALARKGHLWAFIMGAALYVLDTLLFLLFQDYWGLGFHIFVLFGLWSGLRADFARRRLEATPPMPS